MPQSTDPLRPPNRITLPGVLVLLAALGLAGYIAHRQGTSGDPGEGTLARLRRQGTARIGFANEAPYGYIVGTSGEVTGEAPEIARVILTRLGIGDLEPVVTEFGSLIPGLKAGRFDLVAAGMYITPARCEEIAFSNPTYRIGEAFIVRKGNPLDLHSFEDVARRPAARLGVVGGTVEQRYAAAVGVPEDRLTVFPDNASAVTGVETSRVDAFAATTLTVNDLLRRARSETIERAAPFTDPVIEGKPVRGYGAFGFRKGDRRLREAFNRELAGFIGTKEHLDLVRPFGFGENTLPGPVTAEELCAQR